MTRTTSRSRTPRTVRVHRRGFAAHEALVFLTHGEGTLDPAQRTAFERYIQRGGGFVGAHGTTNMDKEDWPWWRELMGGALSVDHPPIQDGTVGVPDVNAVACDLYGQGLIDARDRAALVRAASRSGVGDRRLRVVATAVARPGS